VVLTTLVPVVSIGWWVSCCVNGCDYLSCDPLQISNLSLVKKQLSDGFCPKQADVRTAFVEFSELVADYVKIMITA